MAQLSVHHTGINLCGLNVGVSEHLGHTLNGNAFGKADFRRKRMSGKMEKKKLYEQQIREESITQSTVCQLISLYSST